MKKEIEKLENLIDIFSWVIKPTQSDIEWIVAFFNEHSTDEEDLRDCNKCIKFLEEKIQELKEMWEEEPFEE